MRVNHFPVFLHVYLYQFFTVLLNSARHYILCYYILGVVFSLKGRALASLPGNYNISFSHYYNWTEIKIYE